MSRIYLLPNKGNFYKANLHVHTNISDGRMTPEEVKEIYKKNGYSVVAFTDHQIMLPHPELCDGEFIAITSTEVAKNKGHYMFTPSTHFNVYAKNPNACTYPYFNPKAIWGAIKHEEQYYNDEMRNFVSEPFGYGVEELNKVIKACNEQGYLVCFNHPKGSLQCYRDYGGLKGLWGMECFNTGDAMGGYYNDMDPIDDLLTEGERRVYPIAADDAHSPDVCCHGYVMVKAEELEYGTIMDALEKGDFYASTGVEIKELYLEDGVLHVEIDGEGADEAVLYTPIRFKRRAKSRDGNRIKHYECDLNPLFEMCKAEPTLAKDVYFRVDLKREDGAMAHTKAFFLDEL